MAVYVDDTEAKYGRMIMCHMIADSDEELHEMAEKIGIARKWHQAPPKVSNSHYDIAKSKKALAVSFGAIEITKQQAAMMCARRRVEGILGKPEDIQEWYDDWRAKRREEMKRKQNEEKAS